MKRDAHFSEDGKYRYWLSREWDASLPMVLWIMLNPSTADAEKDDPTIRRIVGFSRSWGCGSAVVANLFALRATDPVELRRDFDSVGRHNDFWIRSLATGADQFPKPQKVVAAWGERGVLRGRNGIVQHLLRTCNGIQVVYCVGRTKAGAPRHPLYVPKLQQLEPYWTTAIQGDFDLDEPARVLPLRGAS